MPPETIEAHTGMKVMTNEEYITFMTNLETVQKNVSDMPRKEGSQIAELTKLTGETATMKADTALLMEFLAKTTNKTKETMQ